MIKLLRSVHLKQQAVKPLEPKCLRGLRYLNVSILRGKKDYPIEWRYGLCLAYGPPAYYTPIGLGTSRGAPYQSLHLPYLFTCLEAYNARRAPLPNYATRGRPPSYGIA
jgi:hypothetical protein